jgi:LPXTG-motif cell wall-anchored protein
MRRLLVICMLLALTVPAFGLAGQAQDSQTADKITSAMSAAPAAVAQGATIMDYPAEEGGAFAELRAGSNGWTCFPDWPATPGNDPMCLDQTWMALFDAMATGTEPNITTVGLSYMLQGGSDASNTDPFAVEPAPGEDWITSGPHVMIVSPVALDTNLFSTDHSWGGPYVMWAGTPYEHIMMPVQAGSITAVAAEAPAALPATGAETGNELVGILVLTGLGLLGGSWLIRRRDQQPSHR